MAVKKPASPAKIKSLILAYETVWNDTMTVLHNELRSDEEDYAMRELIRHMQLSHERLREWYSRSLEAVNASDKGMGAFSRTQKPK